MRIRINDREVETVASLASFRQTGYFQMWLGLTPDDSPLLLRDVSIDEIHALAGTKRGAHRFGTEQLYQDNVKKHHRLIHGVDVQIGRILAALDDPAGFVHRLNRLMLDMSA